MPRPEFTDGMNVAVHSKRLALVMFVEAMFASGPLRMWTGRGQVTWNGHVWQGSVTAGANPILMSISTITEVADVQAAGIQLGASGIPSRFLGQVIYECRQNYPVTVWFGAQNLDTEAVIDAPVVAYKGRMDVPQVSDDGDTCGVTISVENRMIDLQRARERRYTHEDQQVTHPGDLGFQYVAQLQELELSWGANKASLPKTQSSGPIIVPMSAY